MPQPPSQASQLAPGTVLGQRYRVEQLIGSGGYASVYRAVDLQAKRERAIKEVTDTDEGVRRQFELEAGLLINSTHPNIPRGYQLIQDRGRLYLVMEFVRGRDVEELLNESLTQQGRPLDEAQVLRWAIEVCEALEVMHERDVPIIHRDIKPANIKITPEGKPVLIDFGLAKLQTGGPTRTAAQGVSPGFAPPEQYMAKGRTDARSDIYGLGATLYACLTGKDPPEAPSRLLAQTGTTGQSLIPPRLLIKEIAISEATDRAVVRALELSPSHRQQTARALREDLTAALRQLSAGPAVGSPQLSNTCPRCGTPNRADATRCKQCGTGLRPATIGAAANLASTKRAAVIPGAGSKLSAGPTPRAPKPPTPAPAPQQPVAAPLLNGKQQAMPASGKQQAVAASAVGKRTAVPAPATTKQPAVVNGHSSKGKAVVAPITQGQEPAIAGALALAAAAPKTRVRKVEDSSRRRARAAAEMVAMPIDTPRPRSWLHLGGPELSSLGKVALALSAVEVFWGVWLAVIGIGVIVSRGSTQKPYLTLALIWLGVVVVGSVLGAQVLNRPVFRRGRLSALRRGLQGFGLTVYSLALHGVAIWGALVFTQSRPNAPLAIVAFILYAVNVLVAGILSLSNTLG